MTELNPYEKFAENMLHKESKYIPLILKTLINDDQANLLVSMPGTVDQLNEKLGFPKDQIETYLKDMFIKGLSFKKEKNGVTHWRAPAHIAQFHDATIVWKDAPETFYTYWKNYMEQEWPQLAPNLTAFMPRPYTRVIPIGKSIDPGKVKVLSPENIREMIQSSQRVAVTRCTCRVTMKKCDAPIEVCLQINRGADYTIERGSGREITKQEALDIIKIAEDAGLVHVAMNKAELGSFICNCCGCCCQSFTLLISDHVNLCDPSRYAPRIDDSICTGCETCVDRCWFNAISVNSNQIAEINESLCMGCGQCAIGCPENAIQMTEVRTEDFIP